MNSFKNALLVSSVLTTIGFSASATTFIEGVTPPPTDFPDMAPGTPIDFSMYQSVQGTLQGGVDTADFFTFTALTAGDDFSITFASRVPSNQSGSVFTYTADGVSAMLGPGGSKTDTGVLAGTMLMVSVTDFNAGGSFAEGYSVTLSELPASVPEPSAAAIFAIGLAGLAVARRKRHRHN